MEHYIYFQKTSYDLDTITDILTLVLSLTAIIFTTISIFLQKRHNRNAVKPIANISISDYEDKISVAIENNGTGPLIIKSFRAFTEKEIKNNLIDLMPDLPPSLDWKTFFVNLKGFAIIPSKKLKILELRINPKTKNEANARNVMRKTLALVTVELIYEDIYEKEMPVKTKSLDWFGRHFQ